jgi:hypothetical protein
MYASSQKRKIKKNNFKYQSKRRVEKRSFDILSLTKTISTCIHPQWTLMFRKSTGEHRKLFHSIPIKKMLTAVFRPLSPATKDEASTKKQQKKAKGIRAFSPLAISFLSLSFSLSLLLCVCEWSWISFFFSFLIKPKIVGPCCLLASFPVNATATEKERISMNGYFVSLVNALVNKEWKDRILLVF